MRAASPKGSEGGQNQQPRVWNWEETQWFGVPEGRGISRPRTYSRWWSNTWVAPDTLRNRFRRRIRRMYRVLWPYKIADFVGIAPYETDDFVGFSRTLAGHVAPSWQGRAEPRGAPGHLRRLLPAATFGTRSRSQYTNVYNSTESAILTTPTCCTGCTHGDYLTHLGACGLTVPSYGC